MFKRALLGIVGVVMVAAPSWAVEWGSNVDEALKLATQQDKAVLLHFTGSDWCTWCIRMHRDVFATPAFSEYVRSRFVLAEVDVPRQPERVGGKAQLEANQLLCEKFSVRGFPSLLVLSPEGVVVGRVTGYRLFPRLQPELDAALALVAQLKKSRPLQGVAKAKALLEVYRHLNPREGARFVTQIAACDPDNTTGIREIQQYHVMQQRVDAMLWNADSPQDIQAARQLQEEAIALLPEPFRPRARQAADALFAHADAYMHRSRQQPQASAKIVRPQPQKIQEPTLTPQEKAQIEAITQQFNAVGADVDAQIRVLKQALPTASPSVQYHVKRSLLNVLMYKLELMGRAARSVHDLFAMRPFMQQVVDLLPPESRPAAQKELDEKFRNPGQTFIQLKMSCGS